MQQEVSNDAAVENVLQLLDRAVAHCPHFEIALLYLEQATNAYDNGELVSVMPPFFLLDH